MDIDEIQNYIARQNFKVTDHAFEEMKADHLTFQDIVSGIISGEIVEKYPESYPLLACLINGKTGNGEPIHICILLPPLVKIITVYRPDSAKWTNDFRKRRSK